MEKHAWNRVHCNLKSSSHPSSRWGHSCCLINQTVLYFGGYADSTYMNDLWAFNTLTMDWTQIQTTGDIPSHRSNCSMSYDQTNNKVILYGGGAPNKKRFSSIHLLDWTTKQWTEILPKQNEQAPWQRTYHTAQLFYPYLIIFGGQGMTDMDDVWAFNFQTLSWKEITLDTNSPKPCARRFHSSVKIGNQFFIIAGCHGKYRCLNDIYSMDVTELLKNQTTTLRWKQRKVKGSTFLTRWGHSSAVYEGKIYIFGGRFSNDLNDILVVDLDKQTMKAMKTNAEVPKARRRHSACFVGSSMLIFGGFNGEYFNDLNYINVFEGKKKVQPRTSNTISRSSFSHLLATKQFSDGSIKTSDGTQLSIHKAIIRRFFSSQSKLEEFLFDIDSKYSKDKLTDILSYLYKGFDQEDFDSKYLNLSESYEIELAESESEKEVSFFRKVFYEAKDFLSIAPKKSNLMTTAVICLAEEEYINFLEVMRSQIYCDASIIFNKEYCLPVSKSLLKMNSCYFNGLFESNFGDKEQVHLPWQCSKTFIIVFEVMVNYLMLGRVVSSKQFELEHWKELIQLAEYFSLNHLKKICEQQMCLWVGENCQSLMNLSLQLGLKNLGIFCADHQIKMMVNKEEKYQIQYSEHENEKLNERREDLLKQVYALLRFDILQSRIEAESQQQASFKKKESECEEKQNYENNFGVI